jgi:hypothetical protein
MQDSKWKRILISTNIITVTLIALLLILLSDNRAGTSFQINPLEKYLGYVTIIFSVWMVIANGIHFAHLESGKKRVTKKSIIYGLIVAAIVLLAQYLKD